MDFEITEIEGLSGQMAHIYSVIPEGCEESLIEQFFDENVDHMDDLLLVRDRIHTMAHYTGCRRHFFKEGEGAWADGVVALMVLFGSGGHKPEGARTYEEVPELNAKAQQMREIAREINKRIMNRELKIEDDGQLTEL